LEINFGLKMALALLERHGEKKRIPYPVELRPLMDKFVTEVLRSQPEDIYLFLANYFDDLIIKRQEELEKAAGGDHLSTASSSYDEDSEDIARETAAALMDVGLTLVNANAYAEKIKGAFQAMLHGKAAEPQPTWGEVAVTISTTAFLEELHISREMADELATKIQAAFRGKLGREKMREKILSDSNGDAEKIPSFLRTPSIEAQINQIQSSRRAREAEEAAIRAMAPPQQIEMQAEEEEPEGPENMDVYARSKSAEEEEKVEEENVAEEHVGEEEKAISEPPAAGDEPRDTVV